MKARVIVGLLMGYAAVAGAQAPAQAAVPKAVALPAPGVFDPATLDPSVMLVISGGRWVTPPHRGSFRILMLRGDLPPGRSRVVVQWLDEQPSTRRIAVHASRDVDAIPNSTWTLTAPRLEQRDRQWYAVVVGTTDAGRIRRTWRFALDVPGKLREVRLD